MKVDYSKTFIYKLCCRNPTITDVYIGHSTDFKSRNQAHKFSCNNINSKKYNQYNYRFIRENGGYENWIMIKLYDYPCDNKREAEAKETETMIELNATLNSIKPFTTEEEKKNNNKECSKEYYQNNKTEISEKRKVKYENNKTELLEKAKGYYENNKTELLEKAKGYYDDNKTEILEKQKVKYENNKTEINEKQKIYYETNKTEISEKRKIKVKCEFCNCEVRKHNLNRHQKSLKCKKFQGFIDLE